MNEVHAAAVPPNEREARLRASDGEREQVVDLLAEHAAEGRLTPDELEVRIEGAHAARTRGELAVLTADLPADDSPDRTPSRVTRGPRSSLSHPLVAFVAVNLVLVGVWALSGAGYFWPIWPLLGWGLSLLGPGSCGRGQAARHPAHHRPARRLARPTGGST